MFVAKCSSIEDSPHHGNNSSSYDDSDSDQDSAQAETDDRHSSQKRMPKEVPLEKENVLRSVQLPERKITYPVNESYIPLIEKEPSQKSSAEPVPLAR